MKQEITILLVEDDVQACEELKTCIASTEGMRLVGITNNAESAQEVVLSQLTWGGMFLHNLIPVTLGNIIGGALCVGTAYWLSFRKWENDLQDEEKGEKVNE